jgi:hypothetical protein
MISTSRCRSAHLVGSCLTPRCRIFALWVCPFRLAISALMAVGPWSSPSAARSVADSVVFRSVRCPTPPRASSGRTDLMRQKGKTPFLRPISLLLLRHRKFGAGMMHRALCFIFQKDTGAKTTPYCYADANIMNQFLQPPTTRLPEKGRGILNDDNLK